MPQIITFLIGLFSSVGPIAKFFLWIGKKITLTTLILPIQIAFIGSIITFRLSLLAFFLTLIMFLYNKIIEILDFISVEMTKSIFTIPYQVLESLGVISALSDVFSYFSILFVTLILAFISKVALNSLAQLSDEFYKIGVLLQLGIK